VECVCFDLGRPQEDDTGARQVERSIEMRGETLGGLDRRSQRRAARFRTRIVTADAEVSRGMGMTCGPSCRGGGNFVHPSILAGETQSRASGPSDCRMGDGAMSVETEKPDPRSKTLGGFKRCSPGKMANPR